MLRLKCVTHLTVIPNVERFAPQKRATSGLIEVMTLFPPTVLFFINTWTWGYEDILKAISIAFRSKVCYITYADFQNSQLYPLSDPRGSV